MHYILCHSSPLPYEQNLTAQPTEFEPWTSKTPSTELLTQVWVVMMWKVKPSRRTLPARSKGPVRAQLKPSRELGWSGGKAGTHD